jgi:putative Ca2+/H+ antiporter (TMEM165/GDT1 family)
LEDIFVFSAFIASFLFIVLAEMGDKSQLLALAFATKYNPYKVLIAIFIATFVNHTLAVFFGQFLTTIIPIDVISFIAALSFIGFGLWTIRGDKLEGEDKKESKYGPLATVAIAFFLAEMGDKTQLATISLAVEYRSFVSILMGTTLGMVTADAIGIIAGIVLSKRIPEKKIKWFSAIIFMLFGLIGVYDGLSIWIGIFPTLAILALLAAGSGYMALSISKKNEQPTAD